MTPFMYRLDRGGRVLDTIITNLCLNMHSRPQDLLLSRFDIKFLFMYRNIIKKCICSEHRYRYLFIKDQVKLYREEVPADLLAVQKYTIKS